MIEEDVESELVKLANEAEIKDYFLDKDMKILTFTYIEDFDMLFPKLKAIPQKIELAHDYNEWKMFRYKGWYVQVLSRSHRPK